MRYYHQPYSEIMAMPWGAFLLLLEWRNIRVINENAAIDKMKMGA